MYTLPLLAALFVTLAVPGTEPESSDAREQAAESFAHASEAYRQEDYEAALAGFERAQELAPHDKVRFNIALCLAALGRHREAVVELEGLTDSDQLGEEEREQARALAVEQRNRLGVVRVRGSDGERVQLDQDLSCVIPCDLEVDPGSHSLRIGRAHEPFAKDVTVEEGQTLEVLITPASVPPPPLVSPPPAGGTDQPPSPDRTRPSWMMWTGVAAAGAGIAGTIGFGLRAQSLHDQYERTPLGPTRDDGVLMRNLANVSIGVAVAGAVLITADLIRMRVRSRR